MFACIWIVDEGVALGAVDELEVFCVWLAEDGFPGHGCENGKCGGYVIIAVCHLAAPSLSTLPSAYALVDGRAHQPPTRECSSRLLHIRAILSYPLSSQLTRPAVYTSHQKVVLEVDFSGSLWVRLSEIYVLQPLIFCAGLH